MIQSEKFWDKNADLYSKSPVKNKVDDQKKMEVTRGYFQPHTKLFEFACGTGSTAISHAPYVDNVLAIDISSNMLAIAKEKADAVGVENVSFQQSAIEDFNQLEKPFDVVKGHSIIHFLEAPDAVIAKAYNLKNSVVCLLQIQFFWVIQKYLGNHLLPWPKCLAWHLMALIFLSKINWKSYFLKRGLQSTAG